MKILLYLISFILFCIASPGEAQQFEFQSGSFEYENTLMYEGPFYISKDNDPEWIICENIQNETIFELCLQRDATNASLESAEILYWQAWIGFFTLIAAIAAAMFSGYAALQAARGISVALKVAAIEIRPYLEIEIEVSKKDSPLHYEGHIFEYQYSYKINNIGKSEASSLVIQGGAQLVTSTDQVVDLDFEVKGHGVDGYKSSDFLNNLAGENQYLYPNKGPFKITNGISNESIEDAVIKGKDFVFTLVVEYNDSLGTTYKAACAYRASFLRTKEKSYELWHHQYIKLQQDTVVKEPKIKMGKTFH